VDYSLFIMVAMLVMLERLEKRLGTALAAFFPPIFAGSAFVLWFCVYPPPHGENASRTLFIGIFRSSPSI
jgi:hypothetical protein